MLGIFFYYLQTGYVWNNVEMTSIFPAITSLGVGLGFLSALLLLLGSIGALFKKKLMNTVSLITAIVSWIIAVIIAGITGIQVFYTFHNSQKESFTKELLIPLPEDKKPLTINIEMLNNNFQAPPFNEIIRESKVINYIPYEWDNIKAIFSYNILTKDNTTLERISENLSDPIFEIKHDTLTISYKNNKLFDAIVPLARINFSVDLYIPSDWKFNIANPIYKTNLHLPKRVNKRGYTYNTQNCSDRITYDEKENAFFCPLEFNPGDWNFRQKIENDIRNNKTDQLSPLVGLNHEWSITWDEGMYWKLDSILWRDNQNLIVKLSDQMFNLFLEVEATVDENWEIIYSKNTVKEIEQKGMMTPERIKLYEGRDKLANFKPKLQEDEGTDTNTDLEERIWLLEAELAKLKAEANSFPQDEGIED